MMSSIHPEPGLLGEPTLEEVLAEPIIRLIMQRDGVKEDTMRGTLNRLQNDYKSLRDVQ